MNYLVTTSLVTRRGTDDEVITIHHVGLYYSLIVVLWESVLLSIKIVIIFRNHLGMLLLRRR